MKKTTTNSILLMAFLLLSILGVKAQSSTYSGTFPITMQGYTESYTNPVAATWAGSTSAPSTAARNGKCFATANDMNLNTGKNVTYRLPNCGTMTLQANGTVGRGFVITVTRVSDNAQLSRTVWAYSNGTCSSNDFVINSQVPVNITILSPSAAEGAITTTGSSYISYVNITSACISAAITSVTAPSSTLCAGATQTLTANGISAGGTVAWYTAPSGGGSNLGSGITLANAGPGTYYALVTASCNSSTAESSITVATSPATSISSQPSGATYAQNDAPTALSVTATGASSYQWYSNSTQSTSGSTLLVGQTSSTYTPSTASAGTTWYYVVASGCSDVTSNIVSVMVNGVSILTTPTVSDATTPTNQGFTANWSDVANESSYKVNVYDGTNALVKTVTGIAANSTSSVITGLSSNTNYTYKVIAVGDGVSTGNSVESAASNSVRTLSTEKAITAFSLAGQQSSSIDEALKTVSVYVTPGTDKTTLTPTITVSANATVNPLSETVTDFTNPVNFTVTAEDGTTQIYAVSVSFGSSATDYFRSAANGNWGDLSTWETSADGTSSWVSSSLIPTASANVITIRSGHNVTVAASKSADQITVETGGTITVSTGQTLTIADGADVIDCQVNGTIVNFGTVTPTGALQFGDGGVYQHSQNGGTIPLSTWGTGSTCLITGATSSSPNNNSQNFYNFTWNCVGQSSNLNLVWGVAAKTTIYGNFTLASSGASEFRLTNSSIANDIEIKGNFVLSGATTNFKISGSATSAKMNVIIGGNLTVSGGTLAISGNSAANYAWNVSGDVNVSNTTLTKSGSETVSKLFFVKNGTQTLTVGSGVTFGSGFPMEVAAGTRLNMGSSVFNGSGAFTLNAGSTLETTHTSGVNGNVATSGTKTLDASANYIFDGVTAQTTGALLTAANNVEINNSSNVALSGATTLSGALTLTSGKISLGANNLTVGTTINGGSATNYVITDGAGKVNIPANSGVTTQIPVGISASSFDPASVNPVTATSFAVKVSSTLSGTAGDLEIFYPREWDITPAVASSTILSLSPSASVVPVSMTYQPVVYHYENSAYTPVWSAYSNGTFTCTFSNFSPFVTGEGLATALNPSYLDVKVFSREKQIVVNGTMDETISIYTINGQLIENTKATGSQTIINLKSGLYLVSVKSANKLNNFKINVR
ncbi:MAG: T9SS type A sorting domain-containing protein [Bacteroidales bacterium]|nr:T9SS type A sorting domain-containing protein [Bacteroidales bacterium]